MYMSFLFIVKLQNINTENVVFVVVFNQKLSSNVFKQKERYNISPVLLQGRQNAKTTLFSSLPSSAQRKKAASVLKMCKT